MGDFLPNPRNFFESIVGQLYMAAGITIISAWFACFAYYFQLAHFIYFRRFLHYLYKEYMIYKQKQRDIKMHGMENGKF